MTNVKECLRTRRAELYLYRAMYLMKVADGLTGFIRIKILKRTIVLLEKGIVAADINVKLLQEFVEWHELAVREFIYEKDVTGCGFTEEQKEMFEKRRQMLRRGVIAMKNFVDALNNSKES